MIRAEREAQAIIYNLLPDPTESRGRFKFFQKLLPRSAVGKYYLAVTSFGVVAANVVAAGFMKEAYNPLVAGSVGAAWGYASAWEMKSMVSYIGTLFTD